MKKVKSAKPNKKDILKWVTALRSGEYKRDTGYLQTRKGYCCLGVACKLFTPELIMNSTGRLYGGLPEIQPHSPRWLIDINHNFLNIAGQELSIMNDSDKFSFDEIADMLQLVYIEGAL